MMKTVLSGWSALNSALLSAIDARPIAILDHLASLGSVVSCYPAFAVYSAMLLAAAVASGRRPFSLSPAQALDSASRWIGILANFFISFPIGVALASLLESLGAFPGPVVAHEGAAMLGPGAADWGPRGGHVLLATILAASLWPILGHGRRIIAAAFVSWVCVSQVRVGASFPGEVALYCLMGLVIVRLVRNCLWRLREFS